MIARKEYRVLDAETVNELVEQINALLAENPLWDISPVREFAGHAGDPAYVASAVLETYDDDDEPDRVAAWAEFVSSLGVADNLKDCGRATRRYAERVGLPVPEGETGPEWFDWALRLCGGEPAEPDEPGCIVCGKVATVAVDEAGGGPEWFRFCQEHDPRNVAVEAEA